MDTQSLDNNPSSTSAVWRKFARQLMVMPLTALLVSATFVPGEAEPAGLSGSWSGSGWVSFSTGTKEKARCRAKYRRVSQETYKVRAICATRSGKASQTATIYKVTNSRYRGSFYNIDYNVRGTIRVVVSGSSQSVSLSGDGASASLNLSKR
jgi:hypothetical protein